MNRRNFIASASAAAILASSNSLSNSNFSDMKAPVIKPNRLKKVSNVGIIAPATNVSDPEDLRRAKEILDYFELNPVYGSSIFAGSGFRTKERSARIDDIHKFFADESIEGIFCLRGGYGSATLLDGIDYNLIRNNPKVFVGYSDITALHLAIQKKANLVTFHGPVLLSNFTSFTAEFFKKALFENIPIGTIQNTQGLSGIRAIQPIRTIKAGTAQGKITGGNLSLITSLMGTEFEIDTRGSILFIEDVGEEPYRIDRMLNQLALSGKLQQANGIVVGLCSDCGIKSAPPPFDFALGDVLDNYLAHLNIPSFYGLMLGHTNDQATIPYSINAEINANIGTLEILESATV